MSSRAKVDTSATPKRKRPRTKEESSKEAATIYGQCVSVSDRYEKVGRVGEGTYGIVYKAKDRLSGKHVALKRCIPHHESSDGFPVTTLREIQSLRICASHPNIVSLETVAVSKNGVFLVFEYCEHDMAALIDHYYQKHHKSPFQRAAVKTLMQQLLGALDFMHSHHLIHRDVKVSNLLYTNTGMLKVADFGLSRPYNENHMTEKVASLWYRPPELLLGSLYYTQAIDMWAVGCIFGELLQGFPIMNGKTELEQIDKLFQCVGIPSLIDWPALREMPLIRDGTIDLPKRSSRSLLDTFSYLSTAGLRLLTALLQLNPKQRWTASQALESPYFAEQPLPTPVSQMPRFRSQHESIC